jgi:glycosyltransferase involved in cell wall biosynthesis
MPDPFIYSDAPLPESALVTEPAPSKRNRPAATGSAARSGVYPLVTLAVPTLNRTDYLREALESVLAQDYPNLEILVSDNGSRDATPGLARAVIQDDPRVRFRRNEATVPIHEHFTQCIEAARGEFFVLLCDDDRISPSFVSELVRMALRYPEVNVVVPATVTMDEHSSVIETFSIPEKEVAGGDEVVCHWLYGRRPALFASVVTVLTRTERLRRFGGYQGLAGGRNNDNLLFLQSAVAGHVGFARHAVFHSRVHNRSYGANVTPAQIAQSSRQFLAHLQRDPDTAKVLAVLPAAQQKKILSGIRYMTAVELVFHIKTLRKSVLFEMLSQRVPLYRWDPMFCFVALRQYYRDLRGYLKDVRRGR